MEDRLREDVQLANRNLAASLWPKFVSHAAVVLINGVLFENFVGRFRDCYEWAAERVWEETESALCMDKFERNRRIVIVSSLTDELEVEILVRELTEREMGSTRLLAEEVLAGQSGSSLK